MSKKVDLVAERFNSNNYALYIDDVKVLDVVHNHVENICPPEIHLKKAMAALHRAEVIIFEYGEVDNRPKTGYPSDLNDLCEDVDIDWESDWDLLSKTKLPIITGTGGEIKNLMSYRIAFLDLRPK